MIRPPTLDLALIFPIKDTASAWLMDLKADCLYQAGVISESERLQVRAKATETCEHQIAA